ncbi:rac GTPase-activating protein 1 isoform 2-T2 [Acanthopagrus schlegelii]
MEDTRLVVEELLALCLQRIAVEEKAMDTEQEMIEVVKNFETVRKRWLHAELELKKYKELLVKSDVAKAALEVKLKHTRNQLDVEMKKRYKMEGDYQYLDLDTTVIKPLRSRVRERRRSSMGPAAGGKRGRGGNVTAELLERNTVDKQVETTVTASLTTPDTGGHIHMVLGITQENPEHPTRNPSQDRGGDETSVWFPCNETLPELETKTEKRAEKHVFISKTVIRPETCSPCGKRIRFGKMAVKCRNCRVVAHPECKQKFTGGCSTIPTGSSAQQNLLEGFAPLVHPRVPQLVIECVTEIERRGLDERGLYRVPGGERLVKELRERFLQGKTGLMLSKVQDVHVVCGLLKDFLRNLKEPLVTFRLHRTFMEASGTKTELTDEDNSTAVMYRTISDLPMANRDTLAFLMLHLHRVMRSPKCQMDQNNLARVFGPTIVGHGTSEPSPTTIMRDTNTQPKVVGRLLSIPEAYWRRVLGIQTDQTSSSQTYSHDGGHGRLFKPLTSPELNSYYGTPNSGSLRGRIRNLTNSGLVHGRRFFTSPT